MKRLKSIIIVALLLLLFTQCQKPLSVLGKSKMRAITRDLILTESYLQRNTFPDSIQQAYYQKVFKQYGVSRAEYDSSYVWYSANAHRLADIYSQILTELESSKAELDTFLTDSIRRYRVRFEPIESLWSGEQRLYLPSSQQLIAYSQTISNTESFSPSDTLLWQASLIGIPSDSLSIDLQLLITNMDGYRYAKIKGHETLRDENGCQYQWVLPDSIPPSPHYTLFLLLHKPQQPLLIHQIALKKCETAPSSL